VILGEQLCGFIVAIRQDVPWAYMIPIEPILEDIKRKFGTTDVRLPERSEIESLAASSKISETLTAIEVDDQILGSDDRRVSQSAATSDNLPTEGTLPKIPLEIGNHPSNRQGNEIIHEKSSVLEITPEVSMATQVALRPESSGNMIEVTTSTSGPWVSASTTVAHRPLAPIEQLLRTSPPTIIAPSPAPMRDLERGAGASVREPQPTRLQKTFHASYKLWRGIETSLLRIEYRRALRRRRGLRAWFDLASILRLPRYPRLGSGGEGIQSALAQDLVIAWYYVRLLVVAFWNVVLNFLYFITCFPCRFWIVYRHRDVLEDEETLTRQRQESIEMLGRLPMEYNDVGLIDQHRISATLTQLRGVGWETMRRDRPGDPERAR
jgi:hypothetical protein